MKRDYLFYINEGLISTKGNEVTDKPGGKSICDIFVYPNNGGNKPHFHFEFKNGVEGCIRIDIAEYFIHGNHKGTMSNNQLKILDNWLSNINKRNSNFSNWEYIKYLWNENNNRIKVTINDKPDYTTLNL